MMNTEDVIALAVYCSTLMFIRFLECGMSIVSTNGQAQFNYQISG
jgi:hypothetical protein